MKKIAIFFVFVTTIGGTLVAQQWVNINAGYSQVISDVKFLNADKGFIVLNGNTSGTPIRVLKTTNRGTSWNQVYSVNPSYTGRAAFDMIDEFTGFLYFDKKIIKTTNGFISTTNVATFPDLSLFFTAVVGVLTNDKILPLPA